MTANNQTALITGASTGIGKALSLLLAREGYRLILMARRKSLLDELKDQIIKENPLAGVLVVESDVSQYDRHMADVKSSVKEGQTLDLLIANAGIGFKTGEYKNTWDNSLKTFEINLLGAIATIEAGKDIMLRQGFGHIVGISSIASVRGMPQSSAYCSSKAGFSHFLESMRIDLSQNNITVTSIHPGFIQTPMTEKNGYMPWLMSADKAAKKIYKAIKRKRARFYFPWQMMLLARLSNVTPDWVYDCVMKMSRGIVNSFKKNRD